MIDLKLDSVSKVYDKSEVAVSNINLHIQNKEFIVLVGPSGCGKSTTLRMIAGLEEITEGNLFIDGKRMNDVPSKDRDIAMVFQNYALYPHMSVFDNMAFGLKLRKLPKRDIIDSVQDAASILGLTDYLHRKPKALSGGQRQRVALGRAIVRDPKIFLMDEPLSNLDAKLRVQMRAEITRLHQRLQTTTIYVTHDQTEAMTMASRLVVMNDGVIQQVGEPREVYENPENVFVGGFIGSPAMNFFTGVVTDGHFIVGDHSMMIPEDKMALLRTRNYVNKEMILGLRAEDIYFNNERMHRADTATIVASVDVVELTGADMMVYSTLYSQDFVARVDASSAIKQGDMIDFTLHMNRAHFFDIDSEARIR